MPDETPATEVAEEARKAEAEARKKEAERKRLEKIAKEEYEKTSDTAKQAAGATGYFEKLGNQMKLTKDAAKTSAKVTLHTAKLGIGLYTGYTFAGLDALALSGGFMLGNVLAKKKNKEKITYRDVTNRGFAGAIVGIPMHYIFGWVVAGGNYIGNATGSKLVGGVSKGFGNLVFTYGPFVGTDEIAMRIVDWKYQTHIGKDFWKYSYWDLPFKKKLWFVTGPNAALTPLQYQIPVGAGISAFYSYLSAGDKKATKEQEDKLKKGELKAENMGYKPATMGN